MNSGEEKTQSLPFKILRQSDEGCTKCVAIEAFMSGEHRPEGPGCSPMLSPGASILFPYELSPFSEDIITIAINLRLSTTKTFGPFATALWNPV